MTAKVLLDANILFSRTLRDWILQVSQCAAMFRCYGTEHIYAEAAYHLQRKFPDADGAVLTRFRDKFEQCLERIEEFPALGGYPGNDPNDQHLYSAAMAGDVEFIVTADRSFAAAAEDRDDLPYEVHLPDDFLILVDDSEELIVRHVTKKQLKYQLDRDGECHLVERLQAAECPQFAERVRRHLVQIL